MSMVKITREGKREASRLSFVVVASLLVSLAVRVFLIQQYHVVGPSMEPTLMPSDRIIVNKLAYRITSVDRGDVIVFRRKDESREELVKRVIGKPGDTVEIKRCITYLNGEPVLEPYVKRETAGCTESDMKAFYVPEGFYFVMGDNRAVSLDSRKFGAISKDQIIGRATLIVWPTRNWGGI